MTILSDISTNTDEAAGGWAITDEPVRVRAWGTQTVYPLPRIPGERYAIGAAEGCAIRFDDPTGRVSQLHAVLRRDQDKWVLHDECSKNGVWIDGSRRRQISLEAGMEIEIGGVVLLVESAQSIELHDYLARLLGWGIEHLAVVDNALRSVRMAASRRVALILCGSDDLVPLARSIHGRARGADRPFIVCDPRRNSGKATVRSPENCATGAEALPLAAGGSVCVRAQRLPEDFPRLIESLRDPRSCVQLIVCGDQKTEWDRCRVSPIVLPSLANRANELERIIDEYANDAMSVLQVRRTQFLPADHVWVRAHSAQSLSAIEKATRRLVALRTSRNTSDAAERLGMAPVSLSRWIGRRGLPFTVEP
jgi:hypothetical protein